MIFFLIYSGKISKSGLAEVVMAVQLFVDQSEEHSFYYFAYGSCMCPVDLKRSLGESTHHYVIGAATLPNYRLGFFRKSERRNCGVLDIVKDSQHAVEGVLYRLPQRLSALLDEREVGYRHEFVTVNCRGRVYENIRTYTVQEKLTQEIAPNDWYFSVVLRGAYTCGLPEQYCWKLFDHMHHLQRTQAQTLGRVLKSA